MSLHGSPLFVNALSNDLGKVLPEKTFTGAFSTGKDDLFLIFESFVVKISFFKGEGILSFPGNHELPKKNRINQYKEAIGREVTSVDTIHLERAFRIRIGEYFFFFKLFGARANVIFGLGDKCLSGFRKNLQNDTVSDVAFLESKQVQIEDIQVEDESISIEKYPFLKGDISEWLLGSINVSERKVRFDSLIKAFRSPVWQLTENNGYGIGIKNAMDNGTVLFSSSSAIEVQQVFARKYISWNAFNDRQTIAIKILEKELHKSNEKISKIEHELSKHEGHSKYKVYADLIMANLWQIEDGQKEIKLKDFEGKKEVIIPLKKDFSPQKNAERYYRKAKNEHLEIDRLKAELQHENKRRSQIEADLIRASDALSLRDLPELTTIKSTSTEKDVPFKVMEYDGFEIWIGKSAESNEVILRKASKYDTWLHARDVSGSHVLIRNRDQRPVPGHVIEVAASLAAGHSKRKSEGLVAVIYTQRRYVRKFKGARPGQVKVDREEVMLVPPKQKME